MIAFQTNSHPISQNYFLHGSLKKKKKKKKKKKNSEHYNKEKPAIQYFD